MFGSQDEDDDDEKISMTGLQVIVSISGANRIEKDRVIISTASVQDRAEPISLFHFFI
jgi:hypothetical protein